MLGGALLQLSPAWAARGAQGALLRPSPSGVVAQSPDDGPLLLLDDQGRVSELSGSSAGPAACGPDRLLTVLGAGLLFLALDGSSSTPVALQCPDDAPVAAAAASDAGRFAVAHGRQVLLLRPFAAAFAASGSCQM